MRDDFFRKLLSLVRAEPGQAASKVRYVNVGWSSTDPLPHGDFTEAQHPLVRLARLGLVEALRDGKPVDYDELRIAGVAHDDIKFWISKRAIEIEESLGIRLDQAATLFGATPGSVKWPDVFVVMPFAEHLRIVYDGYIREAISRLGLSVERADDFYRTGAIMNEIWAAIRAARVVIADCTGRNPNVFYEIGLAHAIGTPTILLTQSIDDIPFDLRHLRTIAYGMTADDLRKLASSLETIVADIVSSERAI